MVFFRPTLFFRTMLLLLGPLSVPGASSEKDLTKDTFFSWLLPMLTSLNQSNSCYRDLTEVARGLFRRDQWALNMLDAAGRPEANLLGGNDGDWVGSYEQCLRIKKGPIEGQHCWIEINENKILGVCLPKSCKNKDFASLAPSIDCDYSHAQLTMTSYVAIGICCVLLLLILIGTLLEVKRSRIIHSDWVANKKSDERHLRKANSNNGRSIGPEVFSLISNSKSLFSVEQQKRGAFPELNALKSITMALAILNHSYSTLIPIIKNPKECLMAFHQWYSQLILQTYPISIFFLCTGFLTLYSVLRKPPLANKGRFLFNYVVNRYLKLLVAPALIVFIFRLTLLPLSASGPFWTQKEWQCGSEWWKNALFISNWWPMREQCFNEGWFLSATLQLHFLSLVVIVPLIYQRYRMCVMGGSALLVVSWCWLAWKDVLLPLYPQFNDLSQVFAHFSNYNYHVDQIYITPFYFAGPHLVGMGLAWVLFTHKDGISLSKVSLSHSIGCLLDDKQVFFGWIVSLTFLFLTLYGVYLRPNRMLRRVHNIFGTTMYGLFIAWLILVCHTIGNNGLIKAGLRWKYWLPLSKLSLSVYLVHQNVIDYFYMSEMNRMDFTWPLLCVFFVRHWIVSYPLAIVAALCIEMPLSAIVDAIFR